MAALAAVLAVQPASAQSWYNAATPANGGAGYWNNNSADNTVKNVDVCNIGAVLMGFAQNANCNGEVPSGLLPLSSTQALPGSGVRGAFLGGATQNIAPSFLMGAGEYRFDLYGKIAGAALKSGGVQPRFGYFTFDNLGQRVLTEITVAAGSSQNFTTSSAWGFWIGMTQPAAAPGNMNLFFSDLARCTVTTSLTGSCTSSPASQQFSLWTSSTSGAPSVSGGVVNAQPLDRFWLGMEDAATIPGSAADYDYQDVVASFTNLPEPASFALFGTGLMGVLAVGRRRRK
jgi:hypothetical protein